MDESIFYELQNRNTAMEAEIATLRRQNEELKEKLENKNYNDLLAGPEVGKKVYYIFPLWDYGPKRIYWEIAGDHKYFCECNDICILYWVNKNGVARFNAVKSEYVFEEPEYAERACDDLNKRDKEKEYDEFKSVVCKEYNVNWEEM